MAMEIAIRVWVSENAAQDKPIEPCLKGVDLYKSC